MRGIPGGGIATAGAELRGREIGTVGVIIGERTGETVP